MGVEWYDAIARRNGGYKSNASFTVEGLSGELVFEERLIKLFADHDNVLDAGCGHGDFTMKMGNHAQSIIGLDNSVEMVRVAQQSLELSETRNIQFVYASTKDNLPFADHTFDLIYNRRGPTSILNHSRILKPKGRIIGIHSGALDTVKERLLNNGFIDIQIEIFDESVLIFANERELAKFLSGIPGNPDYTVEENDPIFKDKLNEYITDDNRIVIKEWKYIWTARKA